MKAYGYSQQKIDNLNLINNHSNNFYTYKGLNFLTKLKSTNKFLLVVFHGAISEKLFNNFKSQKLEERILFRGYDYDIKNTDIICISDFLLTRYENFKVNWTLSTKNYNVEHIYLELFTYILNHKYYKNVIFFGTSAGGFPSIKFACKFNHIAFVGNAQLYLEEYVFFKRLEKMIKDSGDELLYQNKEIEQIIINHHPKKLIIYNNILDYSYKHTTDFMNFIQKYNLENLIDARPFEYNGIIPEGQNHHHIAFPENYKTIITKLMTD